MNWFRRFMIGRYGVDQLSIGLVAVSFAGMLLSRMTRWDLFYLLALAALALAYFRMLSRNSARRYEENQKFLRVWNPIGRKFRGFGATLQDSRTHCHFKCPGCGQKVRVPRRRGKISITCPACHATFVKKT